MRGFSGSPQPPWNPLSPGGNDAGETDGGRRSPRYGTWRWVPDFSEDWVTWARTEELPWFAEFLLLWLWQRVNRDGVLERSGAPWRPEELAGDPRRAKKYRAAAAALEAAGVLRWTERGDPAVAVFVDFIHGRYPHNRPRLALADVLAAWPEHAATFGHVDPHSAVQHLHLEALHRRDLLVVRLLGGVTLTAQWPDVNRNGRYAAYESLAAKAQPRVVYRPRAGRPGLAYGRNWRAAWVRWASDSAFSFLEETFLLWFLKRCNALGELWRDDQPWSLQDFAEQYGWRQQRLARVQTAVAALLRRRVLARTPDQALRLPVYRDLLEGRYPNSAEGEPPQRPRRPTSYRQQGLY
ncbi:MAG: hypothetical protein EYC70_00360 [Planctomycetota bacterium]|nr:MAG: hypothetical protein EYC70_00360 [Planctomycetota bacterium]